MAAIHPLLKPFKPTESDPFDAVKAAHLLQRAGFGGTPAEIQRVMEMGPQAAVDWLMDFPDAGAEEQSQIAQPEPQQEDDDSGEGAVGLVVVGEVRHVQPEAH